MVEPDMNHEVVKFEKGFGSPRQSSQNLKRHLPHIDKYLVLFCHSSWFEETAEFEFDYEPLSSAYESFDVLYTT